MNESFVNIAIPGIVKLNVQAVAKENAIGVSAVKVSFKAEMPAVDAGKLISLQAGGHVIQGSFQAMQANFGKPYIEDVVKQDSADKEPETQESLLDHVHRVIDKETGEIIEPQDITPRQQAARNREARNRAAKEGGNQ